MFSTLNAQLPQQDWDTAVDASVFYGHETELAQLRQWMVTEHCCMVGLYQFSKRLLQFG